MKYSIKETIGVIIQVWLALLAIVIASLPVWFVIWLVNLPCV